MKGTRLKDVLHEESHSVEFWTKMFGKMNTLLITIENTNPSIDDTDLRWVSDRVERWNSEERILTKKEMQVANLYWNKYNGNINIVRDK